MNNLEHFETAGQAQYGANTDAVQSAIDNADGINESVQSAIAMKNKNLLEKNKINLDQEKAIVSKQKLFLTRARMLQVSRDKNSYKLKIIYTLLAFILFTFIASLGIYVFLKKGGNRGSGNSSN
tara:strand:+ start:186 stop:557 length:372 start_codon:yes stop_codon:yes gene_type:complete